LQLFAGHRLQASVLRELRLRSMTFESIGTKDSYSPAFSYVTFLSREDEIDDVLLLGDSIARSGSAFGLVCLAAPIAHTFDLRRITDSGIRVQMVDNDVDLDDWVLRTLSNYQFQCYQLFLRFNLFLLEGYQRLVFLSPGQIVVRNIDYFFYGRCGFSGDLRLPTAKQSQFFLEPEQIVLQLVSARSQNGYEVARMLASKLIIFEPSHETYLQLRHLVVDNHSGNNQPWQKDRKLESAEATLLSFPENPPNHFRIRSIASFYDHRLARPFFVLSRRIQAPRLKKLCRHLGSLVASTIFYSLHLFGGVNVLYLDPFRARHQPLVFGERLDQSRFPFSVGYFRRTSRYTQSYR